MATASGILSDARVLIDRAQVRAQQNRITYGSEIDTLSIVKDICNLKQICTQSGGLRPFGVAILVAGIDNGTPKLYQTDPTGIFFEYRASVIGESEEEVEDILRKEYAKDLTMEDGVALGLRALKKVFGDKFDLERVDASYISLAEKEFNRYTKDEIDSILKRKKKK